MLAKLFLKWLIVNLLVFTLLSEIIFGLLGLPKEYKVHSHPPQFQPVANKEILYVNLPNSEIDFVYDANPRDYFRFNNTVFHHTNQQGFRGADFQLDKSDNTFRIVFLGDSFTFGEGVYFSDTYPEQFRQLATQAKLFGGKKIEAINLGVGGYNASQEWALLRDFAHDLKPDLIILGYTINDAEPYLYYQLGEKMVRRPRELEVPENVSSGANAPWWLRIFRVNRLIWQYYQQSRQTKKVIAYYRSLYNDERPDWLRTKKAIANFAQYQKTTKLPLLVIIFPLLYQLNEDYPLKDINDKIEQEFIKNGLPVINLLPFLLGKKAEKLWVHPTDQHPNEIVHQIAAQTLAAETMKIIKDKR